MRAEAGAVILSNRRRRLLGDLFELSALTPAVLKGFTEPVQGWRALGEGHAESRFEALHGAQLTPLVGRGEELEPRLLLMDEPTFEPRRGSQPPAACGSRACTRSLASRSSTSRTARGSEEIGSRIIELGKS
jgi:hypothetical protein